MSGVTKGAILKIHSAAKLEKDEQPVVQLQEKIRRPQEDGSVRFELILTDGDYFTSFMLKNDIDDTIKSQLQEQCLIKIKKVQTIPHMVEANKNVHVLFDMEVIGKGPGHFLGGADVSTADVAKEPLSESSAAASSSSSSSSDNQANIDAAPAQKKNKQQYHPIASLNPYNDNWTIKARVTGKGDMREWNNERGGGKLFNIELLDASGGEIRCTFFNDEADMYFPKIEMGKVYIIGKGRLKMANKKFSSLNNDYEISLSKDSTVEPAEDDDEIEHQSFNFVGIDRLETVVPGNNCDVIGVVVSVSPLVRLTSKKTGNEIVKRTVVLTDQSGKGVDLTIWAAQAEKYDENMLADHPVLALKNTRVSDYNGRSITASSNVPLFLNPQDQVANALREWYETTGHALSVDTISIAKEGQGLGTERKNIAAIEGEQLGADGKPAYFNLYGTMMRVRADAQGDKNPWYIACPAPQCNKKVTGEPGSWFCEKCNKSFPTANPRYILSFAVQDHSGTQWITAFNDTAQQLVLDVPAAEAMKHKQAGNTDAFDRVFKEPLFKTYVMKCRSKTEIAPSGEARQKVHCLSASPVDYRKESAMMLTELAALC